MKTLLYFLICAGLERFNDERVSTLKTGKWTYLSDHGVVEEQLAEHDGRLVDHVEALGVGEDLLVLLGDPIPLLILENGRTIPAFKLLHDDHTYLVDELLDKVVEQVDPLGLGLLEVVVHGEVGHARGQVLHPPLHGLLAHVLAPVLVVVAPIVVPADNSFQLYSNRGEYF